MQIDAFATLTKLTEMNELSRACHLAFFHLKVEGVSEFTSGNVAAWNKSLNLPVPNATRLSRNLAGSRDVIKGTNSGSFRLHRTYIAVLEARYPDLSSKSQAVEDQGSLLPEVLYQKTPGYIQSLAKQVNASFEHNIFDGCAVLMRRLEEVLLILSYEHLGVGSIIKDANGNYLMLEGIVRNATSNQHLNLSRNGKKTIEAIRELGNYSAHKITYTCKREYIEERKNEYRALIDELLHKAGLKT